MHNWMQRVGVTFVTLLATRADALPSQCLQAAERTSTCPHLIYKKAALAVPLLEVEKGDIICICLTDLKGLNTSGKSKVDNIDQQVTLERIAKNLQITEADIVKLVKN